MVVKLYFRDGSSSIRSFSDEELSSLGLWTDDSLRIFFENNLNLDGQIEDFTLTDKGEHTFDLREYFKWNESFDHVLIDGLELERVELILIMLRKMNYGITGLMIRIDIMMRGRNMIRIK